MKSTLLDLLDSLGRVRALVIGDLLLDHYIRGRVRRISPEAPVPVLEVESDAYTAGGAANVALNLARLGVRTVAAGVLGDDEAGGRLREILGAAGVACECLAAGANPPTIIKTRIVAGNQQVCRVDREAAPPAYQPDAAALERLPALMRGADVVIFSDYAKGVFGQAFLDACVSAAREVPGLFTAMDPKPARRLEHSGIGLLTPNHSEAIALAGLPPAGSCEPPLAALCESIHRQFAPENLVITLGADGMALCRGGVVEKVMPTVAQEVFDVSGAGDTVIAVLSAAMASGATLENAASLANHAAGCVVAHAGTVPVRRDELVRRISAHPIFAES